MTNGDRIRNMTDEELAKFLVSDDSKICNHLKDEDEKLIFHDMCLWKKDAVFLMLRWLSSEYVPASGDGGEEK